MRAGNRRSSKLEGTVTIAAGPAVRRRPLPWLLSCPKEQWRLGTNRPSRLLLPDRTGHPGAATPGRVLMRPESPADRRLQDSRRTVQDPSATCAKSVRRF